MTGKRAETLLEMMRVIEKFTLARAWNDLSDEEFLWEPASGSWSVRPVRQSWTATPFMVDGWVADFDARVVGGGRDGRAIEPLTSIAWLLWHVGSQPGRTAELDFFGGAQTAASGWTSPYIAAHPIFTTASDAVAAMQAGWGSLDAALHSASDEDLESPTRFWGYGEPGPMGTGAQIVASALNEVSHHGTQICVLRDLFRLRAGRSLEG